MSKQIINLNFNPRLSGSIEAMVTNHSEKSIEYYMSDTDIMTLSSKPHIKSINVVSRYDANTDGGITAYNKFKDILRKESDGK